MKQNEIHKSIWLTNRKLEQRFPKLSHSHETDYLIIGAGITGLSTALELLKRGHKVTICEAGVIGAGTTGGSSGHVDAHPESGPAELLNRVGIETAQTITSLRLNAIKKIKERAGAGPIFKSVPAYYYSSSESDSSEIKADFTAAKKIGLEVEWTHQVPFPLAAVGYQIHNMGRIDCLEYLFKLVDLVAQEGGEIFEKTLVSGPTVSHPTSLKAGNSNVYFKHVVCATHCNYTDVQRLYVQTPPYQSYVLALEVKNPPEDALFWDNSNPYFYVRNVTLKNQQLVLVGGCDHRTGTKEELESYRCLEEWVRERFKLITIKERWSAEFFRSTDELPFIGKAPGKENVWMATGLSGIGLTWGTAAGEIIAELIDGKNSEKYKFLDPNRINVSSLASVVKEAATPISSLAKRVLPTSDIDVNKLKPGQGGVGNVNGYHTAICKDRSGCLHQLSPLCTHMGGVLEWNEAEQTWDCPVHGGRFAANGHRLYGPPESDLEEKEAI